MAPRSDKIIPMHCYHCGAEFAPAEGGLCDLCGEFHCHGCLFFEKGKKEKTPVCINCKQEGKQYLKASRFFPSGISHRRRPKGGPGRK